MSYRCLGVLRESQNSPNRQTEDALILRAVLAELERWGLRTELRPPEYLDASELASWDIILPMCESYPRLKRLASLPPAASPLVVNPPVSVLNGYRTRMVELLQERRQANFPPSEVRRVEDGPGSAPETFRAPEGWWVKRGDVHNTISQRDVLFLRGWEELREIVRDFASREITHYVVQPHIPGDLIKFYGVGPGRWFTWFYHEPNQSSGLPFDTEDLAVSAAQAASALGLEIFGGDAIIRPDRALSIIDINSWPSFAKVRGGAAPHIARHLRARLQGAPGPGLGPAERPETQAWLRERTPQAP